MPIYHRLGQIPQKRHVQFKPQGAHVYEQLFGTEGFSGMSSLLYHLHRPTQIKAIRETKDLRPKIAVEKNIRPMLLEGFKLHAENDYLESRKTLLLNADCTIGLAAPKQSQTEYFYKNADADELLFIHEGSGVLKTLLEIGRAHV